MRARGWVASRRAPCSDVHSRLRRLGPALRPIRNLTPGPAHGSDRFRLCKSPSAAPSCAVVNGWEALLMTSLDTEMHPTWGTVCLVSAGSAALSAIATSALLKVCRGRRREPAAKRQRIGSPHNMQHVEKPIVAPPSPSDQQPGPGADTAITTPSPTTPTRQPEAQLGGARSPGVDVQKLQQLEQRVADLNALAELGKVYQESLSLSAQLRNLAALTVRNDKVLGRGSLAVVNEGHYAGDSVAVKLLPIASVFAEDSRREASLALCLQHANIVRVMGVHLVQVEGKPYLALVQETASGGDLGWQVEDCDFHCGQDGTCSPCMAVKLLLDAARGLAYMHEAGICHADVKSRNLLLFEEQEQEVVVAGEEGEGEDPPADQQQGDTAEDMAAHSAPQGTAAAAAGGGGGGGVDNTAGSASAPAAASASTAAAAGGGGGAGGQRGEAVEPQPQQVEQGGEAGDGQQPLCEHVWALKWCDFGMSFVVKDMPGGACKQAMGTPGFRGPEVTERGWSLESDVFAFGIIMWQLLTGLKPIAYDREWRMHLPHPRLLQFEAAVPTKLQHLALDCCCDSYTERPSMEEVVERLEDVAADLLQQQQQAEQQQQQQQAAAQAAADHAAAAAATEAAAAAVAATAASAAAGAGGSYGSLDKGELARALAAASMVSEPPHLERLHTLGHITSWAPSQQQVQQQQVPHYEVLIENEDDPAAAKAVAVTFVQHLEQQGGQPAAGASAAAAGSGAGPQTPTSSRPSSSSNSPRVVALGEGRTAPMCIARSMSRRSSQDIPLSPSSPGMVPLGEDGNQPAAAAAAVAPAPAPAGWYVAPAESFKQGGGLWLGPSFSKAAGQGGLPTAEVELHQDGPLTSLSDPGDAMCEALVVGGAPAGLEAAAAAAGSGVAGAGQQEAAGAAEGGEGSRVLHRSSTVKRLGADMLAAANVLSKALSAFSTASQQIPGLVTPPGDTPGSSGGPGGPAAAAGSTPPQLLLTQDLIRAAQSLSEALAAVLPSAAALAGQPADAAAPSASAARAAAARLRAIPSGQELHLAAQEDDTAALRLAGLSTSSSMAGGRRGGARGGLLTRQLSAPDQLLRHSPSAAWAASAAAAGLGAPAAGRAAAAGLGAPAAGRAPAVAPARSIRGFAPAAAAAGAISSSQEAARLLLGGSSITGAAAPAPGAAGSGGEVEGQVGSWDRQGAGSLPAEGLHLLRMPSRRGRSLEL